MKKYLLIAAGVFSQLFIWIAGFSCFTRFVDGMIRESLGDRYYSSFGTAARPSMFWYFLFLFILSETAALLSQKLFRIQDQGFLYRLLTLVMNIAVFGTICFKFILPFHFVI